MSLVSLKADICSNCSTALLFLILHYTVQCHYNMVNFIRNHHTRHLIAHPWGWDMGCLFWVQALIYILLWSLQCCMYDCYASAFRRRRHYVFGLSVRPPVRPKPEIPSFDLYMGPLVHPTNRNRFTACPSVRPSVRPSVCPSVHPERFPGICRRMHGGIGLKFYMRMYLDHV